MATFGENLKRIRKSRGLTQAELGEKCKIPLSTLSRYERGVTFPLKAVDASHIRRIENDRTFPNGHTIVRLASALDCTVGELFGEEPQEPRQDKIEIIVKINGNEVMRWHNTDTE